VRCAQDAVFIVKSLFLCVRQGVPVFKTTQFTIMSMFDLAKFVFMGMHFTYSSTYLVSYLCGVEATRVPVFRATHEFIITVLNE
jgi:hypothetical protein